MSNFTHVTAFRRLIDGEVTEFVNASRAIGEPLNAMACMVKRAFELQQDFIAVGVNSPRLETFLTNKLLEPLSGILREIQEFRDRNRHVEEFFNHLSTISESVVALSWVSVSPAPVQFIRDMRDAGQYFGNRVLSTYKGNQQHQSWINKWNDILKGLEQYVKDHHLTGFDWGASTRYSGGAHGEAPLLPPLPPPPPSYGDSMASGEDRHALLNEINQGIGIVRRLRPVNRGQGPQQLPTPPPPPPQQQQQQQQQGTSSAGVQAQQPPAERTYPPKFFLEGRKWRIEHQKDDFSLTINDAEMSQSLAMFKCQNVGLEIYNKMNGISIDNCKRSTIVLSDIIASVELIRCERIKLQCNGHVPLISLDNCDSIQVFLTDESVDAELISSKSTSLNVCLLAPDGDYTELAVPEQIKTILVNRRLQSTVVEKM